MGFLRRSQSSGRPPEPFPGRPLCEDTLRTLVEKGLTSPHLVSVEEIQDLCGCLMQQIADRDRQVARARPVEAPVKRA